MTPTNRYSDQDLMEFKELIEAKLLTAKNELSDLKGQLNKSDSHGTDDTMGTQKPFEDGHEVLSMETQNLMAEKQEKFITCLQNALIRISNKTYGICRISGDLIPKERLRAVPHATLTVESKKNENFNINPVQ